MKKQPDAIITGDWHYRDTVPECRTDDFLKAQRKKIKYIIRLAKETGATILNAGDLFHKAYSNKALEISLIKLLKGVDLKAIPGNHDLVGHSWENFEDSSIGIVETAHQEPMILRHSDDDSRFKYSAVLTNFKGRCVVLIHQYVHEPKNRNKQIDGYSVKAMFRENPGADLIITGDNHASFMVRGVDDRLLINPGSIMRTDAKQFDHRPSIYFWYAKNNTAERVYLPINENAVDISYIEKENLKDSRTNSFVERMKHDYELSLSFQENMKNYLSKNKVKKSVEDIIWDCVDETQIND